MNYEQLKALTVKELKALCKEKGLSGYSKLKEEELISLLLEEEEPQDEIIVNAKRRIATIFKGDLLGKETYSKEEFEKDYKIQKAIDIGFAEIVG